MPFSGPKAMNLLPKNRQKRNQLFITLVVVIVATCGLGFGVIRPQYAKLTSIKRETVDTQQKWTGEERMIQQSTSSADKLADLTVELSSNEQDMATGDIYAWTLDTVRHFKSGYKVELPEIGQPSVGDMDLLPSFPYQQLRFNISGTGYYHDIGKFIADFENRYPHMRVVNLEMGPVGGDSEKLAFRADIVALVKSSQ
jgi:Tfp pilus assembly protein PilO